MNAGMKKIALVILPVLAALILLLQMDLDRVREARADEYKGAFVPPRPEILKAFLLGYHTVVADLYWLEAIQHLSESLIAKAPPDDLYPMTDFITDLDPRFCVTYYFSGLNLALEGSDPGKAALLLEKGRTNCKDNWKIPFVAGYVYYFLLHDAQRAADAMEEASRGSGNPYFALLATRMRAEGGSYELGIEFLSRMIQSSDDPAQKKRFQERIVELQTLIVERDLTRMAKQYEAAVGRPPARIEDLVYKGLIPAIPKSPLGRRFIYDPALKAVRSDPPVDAKVYVPKNF
jgi:hypothetical protein